MLKQYTDFSILSVSRKTKLLAALSIISSVFLRAGLAASDDDIEHHCGVKPNRLKNP